MGPTWLCVLGLFLLKTLQCGHAQDIPKAELSYDNTNIPTWGIVTLTCSVNPSSSTWKYFWYRGEKTSEPLTAQDFLFLYNGQISVSQGGIYWCRGGRRDRATDYSNSIVIYRAVATLQSSWYEVSNGETITIRCEIEDGGDTEWEYEWSTSGSDTLLKHTQSNVISATVHSGGTYYCQGKHKTGKYVGGWSNPITVTMSDRPKAELSYDNRGIVGIVTLTCSVNPSSSSTWKYFWYRGEKTSEPLNTQDDVILSNRQIRVSQGGAYWCRGGRGDPVYYTDYSDSIVIYRAVATLQSSWSEIYYEETIILKCEIENGGDTEWEYEWSKHPWDTLPKHTELIFISGTVYSGGSYYCMGKHKSVSYSTGWSNPIRVSVSARPKAELSYGNVDVPIGGSVTLTCSVNPSSSTWKYFWYRGVKTSEPLTTQDDVILSNGQIRVSQGGAYWCRGGRGDPVYYTDYSDSISINKIVANKAVVTLEPNWSEIYRGETFTLRCEISDGGDTEWDYEWITASSDKPSEQSEYIVGSASTHHSGKYWCKGKMKNEKSSTDWSDSITLTVYNKPKPVVKVSPSWPNPGDLVTLSCEVEHPSAGWRFYWYKAVPKPSDNYLYSYQLLPGSSNGTEEDSYIVHGHTHTAGYACRAGRGDPVFYTEYSKPKFFWSGDFHASASLKVSPDRVQHFYYDSVSLICGGNSTSWRVMRFTKDGDLSYCFSWGTMTGSTCKIYSYTQSDAVYWCESGSGEFSNTVNITVQGDQIILVSPVRPVNEGEKVFLSCKLRSETSVSNVFFYRNEILIQNDSRSELSISAVSKSDEGFYKCQHSGLVSPQSWISVKVKSKTQSSSFPVQLTIGLIFGFLLLLIILLLLCYYRRFKDPGFIRPVQSENTNQDSGHINNQNGALNQAPSPDPSQMYAQVNRHNKGKGKKNKEADEKQDVTYSLIDLKKIGKKEADDSPDVTYSLIDFKKIGKKGKSTPAATDDTVYSEVKPGTTLGL